MPIAWTALLVVVGMMSPRFAAANCLPAETAGSWTVTSQWKYVVCLQSRCKQSGERHVFTGEFLDEDNPPTTNSLLCIPSSGFRIDVGEFVSIQPRKRGWCPGSLIDPERFVEALRQCDEDPSVQLLGLSSGWRSRSGGRILEKRVGVRFSEGAGAQRYVIHSTASQRWVREH